MLTERFLQTVWRNRLYWRTVGAVALALFLMVGISVRHTWTQELEDYIGTMEIAAQAVVESLVYNPVSAETVDKILQTISFGSIHYAQWVQQGKVISERRSPATAKLPLEPLTEIPAQPKIRRFSLPSGEPMVEILVPFPRTGIGVTGSQPKGYLRIGVSLTPAIWRALVEAASLLSLALGALLATALLLAAALLGRALRADLRTLGGETEGTEAKEETTTTNVRRVGGLRIDDAQKRILREDGTPIELSPKEYALLVLLASEPGRVFSDEEIRQHVWPNSHGITRKDVTHYIYLLRKKLERQGVSSRVIENVRGHGYRFSI